MTSIRGHIMNIIRSGAGDTQLARMRDEIEMSIVPPDEGDEHVQWVCNECGGIVTAEEFEDDTDCPFEYDQHENTLGVPPHMVKCEGSLEPQDTSEPWDDRDE